MYYYVIHDTKQVYLSRVTPRILTRNYLKIAREISTEVPGAPGQRKCQTPRERRDIKNKGKNKK